MSSLVVTDLAKGYQSRQVVKNVSLSVKSGEVVGLLGPNGAGKTTSFYMIVGLIPCDKGTIELDGQDITSYQLHNRARLGIGYLPQEASVFRKLSVSENLMAILQTRKDLTPQQQQSKLEQLMEELHIHHIQDSLGMSLSGGERRRVEIARALTTEPKFVLLDEPFAGVDPISVLDIQRIINHLTSRGIGILITDHNVRETLGICGRAYILKDSHVRDVYLGQEFRL